MIREKRKNAKSGVSLLILLSFLWSQSCSVPRDVEYVVTYPVCSVAEGVFAQGLRSKREVEMAIKQQPLLRNGDCLLVLAWFEQAEGKLVRTLGEKKVVLRYAGEGLEESMEFRISNEDRISMISSSYERQPTEHSVYDEDFHYFRAGGPSGCQVIYLNQGLIGDTRKAPAEKCIPSSGFQRWIDYVAKEELWQGK